MLLLPPKVSGSSTETWFLVERRHDHLMFNGTVQEYVRGYLGNNRRRERLTRSYNTLLVQLIWEELIGCGFLDIVDMDPFYCTSVEDYKYRINMSLDVLFKLGSENNYVYNKLLFRKQPHKQQKVLAAQFCFESRMFKVHHTVCRSCRRCSLKLVLSSPGLCVSCTNNNPSSTRPVPRLHEDSLVQYEVPLVLKKLTTAEKLLIQRVSPFVPLVHIKHGNLGMRGHVCSFMQDISGIVSTLPRLPAEVEIIKVDRKFKDKNGDICRHVYSVSKSKVLDALEFLVQHHPDYRDVRIEPRNLDWITTDNGVGDINSCIESRGVGDNPESFSPPLLNDTDLEECEDLGVNAEQCVLPDYNKEVLEECGVVQPPCANYCNKNANKILTFLKSNTTVSKLDWPNLSPSAISEYDDVNIFANAFPWLFPHGTANVKKYDTEMRLYEWAKHLLLQQDGRFARDNIWCFFALNYLIRRQNAKDGSFYVKGAICDSPPTLEELVEKINRGDNSFIQKIMFLNKKVRGTNAYWRSEKAKLQSWIEYHINEGHGPPDVFFTLSCAEHYWPDVIRLLEERIWIADGMHLNSTGLRVMSDGTFPDLHSTEKKKELQAAINSYSIVIQEYFSIRVEEWIKTVGIPIMGIKHYWGRYEFAHGRGQIHAHILGILTEEKKSDLRNRIEQNKVHGLPIAEVYATWAKDHFGLTACLDKSM